MVKSKGIIKIAFIIPAYNEETTINKVIKDLRRVFSKTKIMYEIVVIDDGSTDNTFTRAQGTKVKVIQHIINMGAGSATYTGLQYAKKSNFDIAVTLDADGQHNAKDVHKGVAIMISSNIDLLIGNRLTKKSELSILKYYGNKGLSLLTFMISGIKITDSQSGLRIFSKNALSNLNWKINDYGFCSEMLWRAKQNKLLVKEFPIKAIYTEYSVSKGQSNWNSITIVKSLLQRRILEVFGE